MSYAAERKGRGASAEEVRTTCVAGRTPPPVPAQTRRDGGRALGHWGWGEGKGGERGGRSKIGRNRLGVLSINNVHTKVMSQWTLATISVVKMRWRL